MKKTAFGQGDWAQARSASLEEQARILMQERGGDWQARQRRRCVADGLRSEAARMRQIACRFLSADGLGEDGLAFETVI